MTDQEQAAILEKYATIVAGIFKEHGVPDDDGRSLAFTREPVSALWLRYRGKPVYSLLVPEEHVEVLETAMLEAAFEEVPKA